MTYKDQNVAVLGCGRSGAGAAALAGREGARVTLLDSGDPEKLRPAAERLEGAGYAVVVGEAALAVDASSFDLVVGSPGIALEWPIAKQFTDAGVRLIGETEFAFPFCDAKIVSVSGTNGKTTTVEILEALLNGCGETAIAGGNYGLPLSEIVCSETRYTSVALEVSSFQMEAIETFRPDVAVWTNFAPDHLDRYADIDAYRAAKLRMFENQTADDHAVVNARDTLPGLAAQTVTFSAFDGSADYTYQNGAVLAGGEVLVEMADTRLRGTHNAENLMAAFASGAALGFDSKTMAAAVVGCRAPSHRCELVAIMDGVEYINDSKATNLHALESALVSQEGREVVLIAGGKDKGLPFSDLAPTVAKHAKAAVLIGEIREPLADAWGAMLPCEVADDLDAAVVAAASLAAPDGTVLFAPGTSSFDMFSGYEQRGEAFCAAVAKL